MKKTDIQIAKSLLGHDGIVFVIVKNAEILFSSSKKGIQPFFDALEARSKNEYLDCGIADRVIGKAAIMLAAYLGASEVYTPLASQHAINASLNLNLNLIYDESVAFIINRTQTGMCPMEKVVLEVEDVEEGYGILRSKLM